jgi:GAF domain-containing protein
MLTGDRGLGDVLQRIVASACALTDARYGALGIVGNDRRLAQFVHQGVDEDTVAAIGHLPEGHGILGLLIEDPRPVRLRDLATHPRARGFPAHHPAMRSFLGVPIHVGGEIYGNLYLCDKRIADEFSEADEARVVVLAAAAGSAVANARVIEELKRRERSLTALQSIAVALLAASATDDVFHLVAAHAKEVHSADTVVVVLTTPSAGELRVVTAIGEGVEEMLGRVMPSTGSIPAEVVRTGRPIRLDAKAQDPGRFAHTFGRLGHGPRLFVPMWSSGEAIGTLGLARLENAPPFDNADLALLQSFTTQASVILERAGAQRDALVAVVLQDEERIARELHDSVIRRLFAVGLHLEGAVTHFDEWSGRRERIERAVDELDATIREIRSTVFDLQLRRRPHTP